MSLRSNLKLTPGDFAAVSRKLRTLQLRPSASELAAALREECEFAGAERRAALGFAR